MLSLCTCSKVSICIATTPKTIIKKSTITNTVEKTFIYSIPGIIKWSCRSLSGPTPASQQTLSKNFEIYRTVPWPKSPPPFSPSIKPDSTSLSVVLISSALYRNEKQTVFCSAYIRTETFTTVIIHLFMNFAFYCIDSFCVISIVAQLENGSFPNKSYLILQRSLLSHSFL